MVCAAAIGAGGHGGVATDVITAKFNAVMGQFMATAQWHALATTFATTGAGRASGALPVWHERLFIGG